ncbi:uncharacterized protein DS421_20g696730 [Arachis hypogaea]|nr:uncharacterized protein DS421_20g696730 [Arachis hypogaea]
MERKNGKNQKWRLVQKKRRRGGKDRRRRLGTAAVTAGLPYARSAAVKAAPFIPAQTRFCHHHPIPSPEECHEGERKLVCAGERKEVLVGRRTSPSIDIEPRQIQNCEREGCDAGARREEEGACVHAQEKGDAAVTAVAELRRRQPYRSVSRRPLWQSQRERVREQSRRKRSEGVLGVQPPRPAAVRVAGAASVGTAAVRKGFWPPGVIL